MAKRHIDYSAGTELTYPTILWRILEALDITVCFGDAGNDVAYLCITPQHIVRPNPTVLNTMSAYLNEGWEVRFVNDQDAVTSTRRLAFTPQILIQSLFVIADGTSDKIGLHNLPYITEDLPALFTDIFRPPPAEDQGSNNDDGEDDGGDEPSGGPSGQ